MSSQHGDLESAESPSSRIRKEGLSDQNKEILRRVAMDSIAMGLEEGRPLSVAAEEFLEALREPGAVFVTIQRRGRLRGCIGSYLPRRPLVEDVAENAFAAAFRDPRFPPLTPDEMEGLDLHISLLTPLEPLLVKSRKELIETLVPRRDGLLLEEAPRRSTFLPQVWESLPEPQAFLEALMVKAGFSRGYWSPDLVFHRYRVEEF